MRLIIPMGGIAKRMRPHSLYKPKPLMRVAGKPILYWIFEEIQKLFEPENIIYILPPFFRWENELPHIEKSEICIQEKALGTAHAIMTAREHLEGEGIIVFPDMIFRMKDGIKVDGDGAILTYRVEDPTQYGVVITNGNSIIKKLVEKPSHPISNQAIIGIYYLKKLEDMVKYLERVVGKPIDGGEYHITDALMMMVEDGAKLVSFPVEAWYDCGCPSLMLEAQRFLLRSVFNSENHIEENVSLYNSQILGNVWIERNCVVENSILKDCIIYEGSVIKDSNIKNSIVGEFSKVYNFNGSINAGPYTQITQ